MVFLWCLSLLDRLKFKSLFCILAMCSWSAVFGRFEVITFQKWNVEDGLSNSIIRNIAQDSAGYLWLATEHGLNRFDGLQFKHYFSVPGDSSGLSHNSLFGLGIDASGMVWAGSDYGLNLLNPESGEVQHFYYDSLDENSLSDNYVRCVFVDSRNRVWVGTQNGLNRYQPASGDFFRYPEQREFDDANRRRIHSYNRINTVFEDNDGAIWVGTDGGGIKIYRSEGEEFEEFFIPGEDVKRQIIRKIYQDTAGDFWFGTDGGLAYFQVETQQFDFYTENGPEGLSNQFVWGILEDQDGLIWVSTYRGGISLFDKKMGQFVAHLNEDTPGSLSSEMIWTLFQDRDGGIWVGTDGQGGLNYWNPLAQKMRHYLGVQPNESKHVVKDVLELTSDILLVVSTQGFFAFDQRDRSVKFLEEWSLEPMVRLLYREGEALVVSGDEVVLMDSLLSPKKTYKYGDGVAEKHPTTLALEGEILWIGTLSAGLLQLNLKSGEKKSFFSNGSTSLYQDSRSIKALLSRNQSELWVSSVRSGLFRMNTETDEIKQFFYHTKDFFEPTITSMVATSDSVLWLGTQNEGLIKFDTRDESYEALVSEGTLTNEITALIAEENGKYIWLTSKNGMGRFDIETGQFHEFTIEDGLQSRVFNQVSHQGRSGVFYFGGVNGINAFNPDEVILNPIRLKVFFEDFMINEVSDPERLRLASQGPVSLSYDENDLSFSFVAPAFLHANKVSYAYRLSEKEDWKALGSRRNLNLPKLSPGKYHLQVRATNNDGFPGGASSVFIEILPPWWQTWWFRLLSFFGAMILLGSVFVYRVRRIQKQKIALEHIVEERTTELKAERDKAESDKRVIEKQAVKLRELDQVKSKFFANISHELRTPLTLINAPLEAMLDGDFGPVDPKMLKALETARSNGGNLLVLVEEILDLAKLEAGKLRLIKNPVLISELIDQLFAPYAFGFAQKKIAGEITLDIPEGLTLMIDEKKFSKIINNLLSNASKFTPAGGKIHLLARYQSQDGTMHISVSDTGSGIHPDDLPFIFDRFYQAEKDNKARGGTGIGLALSRELAHLFGGQLAVSSVQGQGTEFTFDFPAELSEYRLAEEISEDETFKKEILQGLVQSTRVYSEYFQVDMPAVLIAEDNDEMRSFIHGIFQPYFDVTNASDGQEAWDHLESGRFDILVSDWMMPRLDGFELMNKIKETPELGGLSIVMLTARSSEEDKLQALTAGVDDYLTKPFNKWELLARVKNILQNRMARKDKESVNQPLSVDQEFMNRLQGIVSAELKSGLLSVSYLASELAMSERQLQRKIKAISGLSPQQLIKEVRLQKSRAMLMAKRVHTVAEAANLVGFDKTEYFSSQFTQRFGKRPSDLLKG